MSVVQSIEQLGNCFEQNELAYFALTSQVEQPIRDKLAFYLFNQLAPELTVLREWNRVDIAILADADQPESLLELTAMQTCDLALKPELAYKVLEKVVSEEAKLKKLSRSNTERFTLLLATHIHHPIPKQNKPLVKYSKAIGRAFDKIYYPDKIKSIAQDAIITAFNKRQLLSSGEIQAGVTLATKVSILYWVYKS